MSCITRQSIYRTFFWLDKRGIIFRPVDGVEVDDFKSIKARSALCNIWMDAFAELDETTWESVVKMVLTECKQYPSVEQIYEFINRLPLARSAEPEKPAPPAAVPPAPKPAQRKPSKNMDERLRRMFELAKEGRWREAAACSGLKHDDRELEAYAQKRYPAKCSPAWIAKNHKELLDMMREEERCHSCTGFRRCATKGFTYIGLLDKNGNVTVKCIECIEKVKMNEKVQ